MLFFQPGELRENGTQMRVVQVTIANTVADPLSPLWNRLRQHRGTVSGKFAGGGNHRVSDFRSHIGSALVNREELAYSSWGRTELSNAATRKQEHPLEVEVSRIINHMPFLWISTDYSSNPIQLSQFINRNTLSLLSNYQKKLKCDLPSQHWLGHYCSDPAVRISGLWNNRRVDIPYNLKFLDYLEKLIKLVHRDRD